MEPTTAVRILVSGRVQGVGFRAWVQHEAELRALGGWVRNRRDGSVEAVFTGPGPAVDAMVEACRKGPRTAAVERVDVMAADPAEWASGFAVRPTA
jgi:acylphosphatase